MAHDQKKSETSVSERDSTVHAELLCCGCGELGCKAKSMEDLWFAERDHQKLVELKSKENNKKPH